MTSQKPSKGRKATNPEVRFHEDGQVWLKAAEFKGTVIIHVTDRRALRQIRTAFDDNDA
jgi:hypothetical protein